MPVYSDTIGIYINDSSLMVSFVRNDNVELLTNFDSIITFPLVFTISSNGNQCCNKYIAKSYPDKTISNIFRIIGKSIYDEDVQKEMSTSCIPIKENEEGEIGYWIENHSPEFYTPEIILTEIISFLQELLKKNTDLNAKYCVLSVSSMLSPKQRDCVQSAIEKSGLHVIHFIEEAMCIGYYFKRECQFDEQYENWQNDTFLVYNLSDKNLTISVFNYLDDKPNLITTYSNCSVSGNLLIQTIIKYVEDQINQKYKVDLLNGMNDSLIWQKEYSRLYNDILIQLFALMQVDTIDIELPTTCKRYIHRRAKQAKQAKHSRYDKSDDEEEAIESIELTRSELASILHSINIQFINSIQACLSSCHLQVEEIQHVIPVSQFSDIVIIKNKLCQLFGEEKVYKRISGISCISFGLGDYILDFLLIVYFIKQTEY